MTEQKGSWQLSEEVTQMLLYEISNGRYANVKRLPPEIVLAEELGVSRNLLRDCLISLEREGFISRKHGVGTVINKHVLDVATRMDLEKEFLAMVGDAGYEARIAKVEIYKELCSEEVAARLAIKEKDPVYRVERLITADGRPAIFCTDFIALSLIKNDNYDEARLKRPIFEFLEVECETAIHMDLTKISAVLSDGRLSDWLKVEQGSPLLYMDEIGYDFYGKPVLYSQEYYVEGILKHTVLRKKI